MLPSVPAIDTNTCGDWTENQLTAYNSLPFYLAKYQSDVKKWFPTFSKITTKRQWKQNNGPILRGVKTNMSPNLRQFANPNLLSQQPLVDVMDIRENTNDAQVRWHQFESPIFNFYPEFNDFMSHIDDNAQDITQKIERFNEVFIRGMMLHMSPFIFVCNANGTVSLVNSPYWSGSGTFDPTTQGKTQAFIANNLPGGTLGLSQIEMCMTIMETQLRIPFFSGSDLPSKDDAPLTGKFLFILNSECYNQFIYDKLALTNRAITLDLLTNGFYGSFFGRGTSRLEDLPLTFKADGSFPAPELRVNVGEQNAGETMPSPAYSLLSQSPYRIGFIAGKPGYDTIETGNPPGLFTGNKFPDAPSMNWSNVPRLTKNFLVKCTDAQGVATLDTNRYGHWTKLQAEQTFGILAKQRRSVIPIFYMRREGPPLPP